MTHIILFGSILLALPACVLGDSLEDARQRCLARMANVEKMYTQVHMSAVCRSTRVKDSKEIVVTEELECIRDGELQKTTRRVVESSDEHWPAGTFAIFGGSSDKYYDLYKLPSSKAFTFSWFGPKQHLRLSSISDQRPLYAPFTVGGLNATDALKKLILRSVKAEVINGLKSTTFSGEIKINNSDQPVEMSVEDSTCQVLMWAGTSGDERHSVRCEYKMDNGQLYISHVDFTVEVAGNSVERKLRSSWDVHSLRFVQTDKSQFDPNSLKEYGVIDIPATIPPRQERD